MEKLVIDGSAKTPSIDFNSETGTLALKGRSIPENSIEFYKPLNEWFDMYASAPREKTVIATRRDFVAITT